jgi:hypothetical protein
MTAKKPSTPSTWVDPDDAPELTEEWFETADQYIGNKLVKRGRPKSDSPKQAIKLRPGLADPHQRRPARIPESAGARLKPSLATPSGLSPPTLPWRQPEPAPDDRVGVLRDRG